MTPFRLRTEWQDRYHVEQDADATVLDCFTVTLLNPLSWIVHREGVSMDVLFQEAKDVLAHLRALPRPGWPRREHFEPFGVITACSYEELRRELTINWQCLLAEMYTTEQRDRIALRHPQMAQEDHERSVKHLCRTLDLIRGAPLPVTVPWPDDMRYLKDLN